MLNPTAAPRLAEPRARPNLSAHPLIRFVLRRCMAGVATVVVASLVIFFATSVVPGSPATAALGRQATPRAVAQIDRRIGYDKPLFERYVSWLGGAVHGNLGNSATAAVQGETAPIWPIIRGPLGNTATLAIITMIVLVPLSLILGLISALHAGRWPDHVISSLSLIFVSMPEFVVASLLIAVFAIGLPLLPPVSLLAPGPDPLAHPNILVLPVLTLLAVSVAWTIRLIRAGAIEVLDTDYVQTARLQGLPERKILRRYVLRNALAPSVQIFALSVQYLLGGVIVTESVFNYPGLGKQLVNAVQSHDNTQVQGIALVLGALYILVNIIADLVVVLLVPKLRTQA